MREARLNEAELALFNEFFESTIGITFPEHKREMLEARLRPRLSALGLRTFLDYYLALQFESNGRRELHECARLITNNETYFFRETSQIENLFGHGLEEMQSRRETSRRVRFLSAGCSSGEEPYTLSVIARENQYRLPGYEVEIDAFDISEARIAMARAAEYGPSSLRSLQAEQLRRYFNPGNGGLHRLKPMYRTGVTLRPGNLLDGASYAGAALYDVIFCRNVLIYFSPETVRAALRRFADALCDGGLLLLGHSESVIGVSPSFEPIRLGSSIVYRRTSRTIHP